MNEAYYTTGMRCIKCRVVFGSLLTTEHTPEQLGAFLMSKKIYPICEDCHRKNPRNLSRESVEELI